MINDIPTRCTKCDRKLDEDKIVYLELNNFHGTYHKAGTVPNSESQGAFPFGADCAKKVVKS